MLLSRCSAALPDEGHHAVAVPPKGRPLHSVIAETLANVELLLAQLEAGVRVADSQRGGWGARGVGHTSILRYRFSSLEFDPVISLHGKECLPFGNGRRCEIAQGDEYKPATA